MPEHGKWVIGFNAPEQGVVEEGVQKRGSA